MEINRRGLIVGLASFIAAPAVVRAGNIMPVRRIISTMPRERIWQTWELKQVGMGMWCPQWGGHRLIEGTQGRISFSIRGGDIVDQQHHSVRTLSWVEGNSMRYIPAGILDDSAPSSYQLRTQ